jgi:hypothetical protein
VQRSLIIKRYDGKGDQVGLVSFKLFKYFAVDAEESSQPFKFPGQAVFEQGRGVKQFYGVTFFFRDGG